MNKLAIQETFPPGIVGREIVLAQMCHHYRRISTAKARVNTNLFKPPKISLSRPLSAEIASIVQRSLSPRSPPKHRRCLKYEHEMEDYQFKPSIRSQGVESRLRSTPEVYHPAIKYPRPLTNQENESARQPQATQTSLENSLIEEEVPKTRDEGVQTSQPGIYRPIDSRSIKFLRDITTDALQRRAFNSSALNRIFLDHQFRNNYSLPQELMDKELEELRRQLGMLPKHRSNSSSVSDSEALDALDTLVLDPRIKEQVIHSLRLSRSNDVQKSTNTTFDGLKADEGEQEIPTKDSTSSHISEQLNTEKDVEELTTNQTDMPSEETSLIQNIAEIVIDKNGLSAELDEEDRDITSASSSKGVEEEEVDGEVVESMMESDEGEIESLSEEHEDECSSEEEELEEITQRESTESKPITTDGILNTETEIEEVNDESNTKAQNNDISSSKRRLKRESSISNDTQPLLPPLKIEPLTARGDKWRASLEAVKEESDSTTGQISDISTASTPTDPSKKDIPEEISRSSEKKHDNTQPSSTYHSLENDKEIIKQAESVNTEKDDTVSSNVQSQSGKETSSSTGGEIVRQMGDLLAEQEDEMVSAISGADVTEGSMGLVVKHMDDLDDSQFLNELQAKEINTKKEENNEDDANSDDGSDVESVQSEIEEDSKSEEELSSVHTDASE